MKTSHYVLLVAIGLAGAAFQNCAKSQFDSISGNGTLVEKADTSDTGSTAEGGDGVIPGTGTTGMATDGTMGTPVTVTEGTTGTTITGTTGPGNSGGHANTDHVPSVANGTSSVSESGADGDGLYVCVLAGPGDSIKVGLVDSRLVGKVATPNDVCMSKNACNNIISQFFRVKGPAFRGFCPDKNPHVSHLTDAQIQTLINDLKK